MVFNGKQLWCELYFPARRQHSVRMFGTRESGEEIDGEDVTAGPAQRPQEDIGGQGALAQPGE
jgi:hypothetical protein